ncbi:MAG: SMP-30/gluconolactonase/LRE family protein [Acidobacteriota bacterium]
MRSGLLMLAGLIAVAGLAISQVPPAARTTGPGVQAAADSRYPEMIATCKTPPPGRGGGAPKGGAPKGGGGAPKAAAAPGPREYTVAAIPGVVAAGVQWKEVWQVDGNNADGAIPDKNGDLLIAQNDNSAVVKLDVKTGKISTAFSGTNTGGSLTMNSKGAIFVVNRGLNPSIERLTPKRGMLATKYNGDVLDCLGTVLNDSTSDSKGGVYFTAGTVYYADPTGKITKYGENLNTNGIMLSADEKKLFVTNGPTLAVFDVQKDGSLTNQREFTRWEAGGGDGSAFDAEGRLYVTTGPGIQVISAEGKNLGLIPTPRGTITVTWGGKDRKTLYAVSREGNRDWIIALPMLAQGPKGRAK